MDKEIIKELRKDLKTYKEFLNYLENEAIGDKMSLIETFNNNSDNIFIDYVNVEKKIEKNKLLLSFKCDNKDFVAEWESSYNYGAYQVELGNDGYYGYLLFPTHNDTRYFLLHFQC